MNIIILSDQDSLDSMGACIDIHKMYEESPELVEALIEFDKRAPKLYGAPLNDECKAIFRASLKAFFESYGWIVLAEHVDMGTGFDQVNWLGWNCSIVNGWRRGLLQDLGFTEVGWRIWNG